MLLNIISVTILVFLYTTNKYSKDGWIYMTVKTNGEKFINKKFPKMTFYYGTKGNIGTEISEVEEILNEITKNKYDSRIIECDLKEVDKFFEENIDLDYENLKNKFEKIFLNIPDNEKLENQKNKESLEKEE